LASFMASLTVLNFIIGATGPKVSSLMIFILWSARPRTVGRKKAWELICLGEIIDAHEAEKMGMITKAVEGQELDDYVEKLAEKLRNKSGAIFRLGLEAYYTAMDMEYEKSMAFLRDTASILTNSPDSMEGTKAFMEKRKPRWTT